MRQDCGASLTRCTRCPTTITVSGKYDWTLRSALPSPQSIARSPTEAFINKTIYI